MTYRELLKELQLEIKADDEMDDEVVFDHLLDWLACLGVEGAAEAYQDDLPGLAGKKSPKHSEFQL